MKDLRNLIKKKQGKRKEVSFSKKNTLSTKEKKVIRKVADDALNQYRDVFIKLHNE